MDNFFLETFIAILVALLSGVMPSLIWLYFWMKEDSKNPEPTYRVMLAFAFGTVCVPVSFLFELFINGVFFGRTDIAEIIFRAPTLTAWAVLLWAFIEEITKYYAAKEAALDSRDNDEPVDATVYLIATALGFSALENTLYILTPVFTGNYGQVLLTTNLRFVGATLLHVAASAIIGICIGFTFKKSMRNKIQALTVGVILATGLHAFFNIFIMRNEQQTLFAFLAVWVIVVFIITMFEKLKKPEADNQQTINNI